MNDFRAHVDELLASPGASKESRSSRMRLESGPDGVRVEIDEDRDGRTQKREYTADSLDQLYREHPELRDELRVTPLGEPFLRRELAWLSDRLGAGPKRRQTLRGPSDDPKLDRLGILMREPGSWSASVQGLEEGTGLYVEKVFPRTLAHALGLRAGDILVRLNGRTLRSGDDVRAALEERAQGETVEADVLDELGCRETLSWTPPKASREIVGQRS